MTPDNATEAAFVAAGGRLLRSMADGARAIGVLDDVEVRWPRDGGWGMSENASEWWDDEPEPDCCYGSFPGGDPRCFEPDPEVCTVEELEAHAAACREADAIEAAGGTVDWEASHRWLVVDGVVAHLASNPFGVGLYWRS